MVMGRLAARGLVAQAVSPLISAVLLETAGATYTLVVLLGIALLSLTLVSILAAWRTRFQGYLAGSKESHAFSSR
jgi:hypothetical protein